MNAQDAPVLTALVELACRLRPDWSARDVQVALRQPACWDRPVGVVAAALLVCAADPETRSPGRVCLPGRWWDAVGVSRPVARSERPVLPPPCPEGAARARAALEAALAAKQGTTDEGDGL